MNNILSYIALKMQMRRFQKLRPQIYAQMAFALEHDANVRGELEDMVKVAKYRNSAMLPIYQNWLNNYKGRAAGRLSASMAQTVSREEMSLIASAEETQKLASGFRFLSQSTAKIAAMQKAITSAVRSIFIPSAMLVGLLYGIDEHFFPVVAESIPREEWGTLPTMVSRISHNISALIAVGVLVAPALYLGWKYSLTNWTGKGRLFFEKTILYSKYRDFHCAVFLVNLAFLMEAGKPPREALEKIYENSSIYLKWHIGNMLKKMDRNASNMGQVLVSTGLFSEALGDLLTNYSRWTDWHTQISEIAYTALKIVTDDVMEMSPRLQEGLKLCVGLIVFLVLATVGTIIMAVMQKSGIK